MPYIYVLKNTTSNDVYYGSTKKELYVRLGEHKSDWKRYSTGIPQSYLTSFEVVKCPTSYIELVEEVSKEDRYIREGFWIRNNPCVNLHIPTRTSQERYLDNHEEMLEERRQYYQNHKEKMINDAKHYVNEHKEDTQNYHKQYYLENKDKLANQHREMMKDPEQKAKAYERHLKHMENPVNREKAKERSRRMKEQKREQYNEASKLRKRKKRAESKLNKPVDIVSL